MHFFERDNPDIDPRRRYINRLITQRLVGAAALLAAGVILIAGEAVADRMADRQATIDITPRREQPMPHVFRDLDLTEPSEMPLELPGTTEPDTLEPAVEEVQ